MTCECMKNAHLQNSLGVTFIRFNELGRASKNLIDVNFHLQKSLGIFKIKSSDKKDKGIKVSPPVPNRVNA